MAELAPKGTYVKIEVHVWPDRRSDSIHITSNDPDLPPGGMHMTAKKGTQSDRNLRALLEKMLPKPSSELERTKAELTAMLMAGEPLEENVAAHHVERLAHQVLDSVTK